MFPRFGWFRSPPGWSGTTPKSSKNHRRVYTYINAAPISTFRKHFCRVMGNFLETADCLYIVTHRAISGIPWFSGPSLFASRTAKHRGSAISPEITFLRFCDFADFFHIYLLQNAASAHAKNEVGKCMSSFYSNTKCDLPGIIFSRSADIEFSLGKTWFRDDVRKACDARNASRASIVMPYAIFLECRVFAEVGNHPKALESLSACVFNGFPGRDRKP